jgi:hypothetical protein
LRTNKNNNFKFTIRFLMTLDRSYIGYLGFLGIDLFKSVLMYSNGAICLIKLLFKMGLFTVYSSHRGTSYDTFFTTSLVFISTFLTALPSFNPPHLNSRVIMAFTTKTLFFSTYHNELVYFGFIEK